MTASCMVCILQTGSQTCWKACAVRSCTKVAAVSASVHAARSSAYDKCQQPGSMDQVSVCEVQMAVARAEQQVGAFKGPVVVLADMDKAEMDAAMAKGLQGCKMEVQTSWLTHSLVHSLAGLLNDSLTHLLARSLSLTLAHSRSLSLTHSLAHSLTHPPTRLVAVSRNASTCSQG